MKKYTNIEKAIAYLESELEDYFRIVSKYGEGSAMAERALDDLMTWVEMTSWSVGYDFRVDFETREIVMD